MKLPRPDFAALALAALLAGCAVQQPTRTASARPAPAKPAAPVDEIANARTQITQHPEDWRGYNRLGLAYYRKNQFDRAAAAFEQALQLHPVTLTLEEEKKQLDAIAAQKRARDAEIARQQAAAQAAADAELFSGLLGAMAAGNPNMRSDQAAMLSTANTLMQAGSRVGVGAPVAMPDGPMPTSQLKARRESAEIHSNLGMACFGAQRWSRALAAFEQALSLDPSKTELLRRIAETHLRDGSDEKAAIVLHRYLAVAANAPRQSRVMMAGLLASLGLEKEAAAAHAALIAEDDERLAAADSPELRLEAAAVLLNAGQADRALASLRLAAAAEHLPPARRQDLATLLFLAGGCADAVPILEKLTAPDAPAEGIDRAYALTLLGRCRDELGQPDAARDAFTRALAGIPAGKPIPEHLVIARIETGHAAEAVDELIEAYQDKSDTTDDHITLSRLALAYEKSGRLPHAIAAARLALERRPTFGPARRHLDRLERAAAPIRRAALDEANEAADAGDSAAVVRRLCVARLHATAPAERAALDKRLYETLAKLPQPPAPSESAARLHLQGNAAFKSAKEPGDLRRAVAAYDRALVESPAYAAVLLNRSLALSVLRDYRGAEDSLRLYLLANPGDKNADTLLARMYELAYQRQQTLRDTLRAK